MALVLTTVCDTTKCLALHVGLPGADAEHERAAAEQAGWDVTRPDGPHHCPACSTGGDPVLELGECPKCHGRQVALARGERCLYCRHLAPYPPGDD
jgi:hypothetical protein